MPGSSKDVMSLYWRERSHPLSGVRPLLHVLGHRPWTVNSFSAPLLGSHWLASTAIPFSCVQHEWVPACAHAKVEGDLLPLAIRGHVDCSGKEALMSILAADALSVTRSNRAERKKRFFIVVEDVWKKE